jgi:hypothetical protein
MATNEYHKHYYQNMSEEQKARKRETNRLWRKKNSVDFNKKSSEYQRKRRSNNIQSYRDREKDYYFTNKEVISIKARKRRWDNLPRYLCKEAERRANKLGIPFDLSPDYIYSIWPKDNTCPVFGTEFVIARKNQACDTSASIDRINPRLGYIIGNVAIISGKANRIKNDATQEEIQAVLDYVKENK